MKITWTLPNILTVLRIALSPVFLIFLLINRVDIALVVFMFVAVTDFADGWVARSTNQKTKFGESLDPMADKFMIFLALFGIYKKFGFPFYAVPLFISRDIVSLAGSFLIFAKHKEPWKANKLGKLTTFLQIACILFFILNLQYKLIVLWITIASSLITALTYAVRWVRIATNKHHVKT